MKQRESTNTSPISKNGAITKMISNHPVWKQTAPYWAFFRAQNFAPKKLWWWAQESLVLTNDFTETGALSASGKKKVDRWNKTWFTTKIAPQLSRDLSEQLREICQNQWATLFPLLRILTKHFNYQIITDSEWKALKIKPILCFDQDFRIHSNFNQVFRTWTIAQKIQATKYNYQYLETKLIAKIDHHFRTKIPELFELNRWAQALPQQSWWNDFQWTSETNLANSEQYQRWLKFLISHSDTFLNQLLQLTSASLVTKFHQWLMILCEPVLEPSKWWIKLFPQKVTTRLHWLPKEFYQHPKQLLMKEWTPEIVRSVLQWSSEMIVRFVAFDVETVINHLNDEIWTHVQTLQPKLAVCAKFFPELFTSSQWLKTTTNYPIDWVKTWKPWQTLTLKKAYNHYSLSAISAIIAITPQAMIDELKKVFDKQYQNYCYQTLLKLKLLPNHYLLKNWPFWKEFGFDYRLFDSETLKINDKIITEVITDWTVSDWVDFWSRFPKVIKSYFEKTWINHWKSYEVIFKQAKNHDYSLKKLPIWSWLHLEWPTDLNDDGSIVSTKLPSFFEKLTVTAIKNFIDFSFKPTEQELLKIIKHQTGTQVKKLLNWQATWETLLPWYLSAKNNHLPLEQLTPFKLLQLNFATDLDSDRLLTNEAIKKLSKLPIATIKAIEELNEKTILLNFFTVWAETITKSKIIPKLLAIGYDFTRDPKWVQLELPFSKIFKKTGELNITPTAIVSEWRQQYFDLFKFNVDYLKKILTNQTYLRFHEWFPKFQALQFLNFSWKNYPKFNAIDLTVDQLNDLFKLSIDDWRKKIFTETFDLVKISQLTPTDLEQFLREQISNHWKTVAPDLALIKELSLLFGNQELWLNLKLNWQTDLQPNGFYTETGLNKLVTGNPSVWQAVFDLTAKRLETLINEQINQYWTNLNVLFHKIWISDRDFFTSPEWKATGITIDPEGKIFESSLKTPLKTLTNQNLLALLKFQNIDLQKRLLSLLENKWQMLRPQFRKILIFDRKKLFDLPELKTINFDWIHGIDADTNLVSHQKEQMFYWSLPRWTTFFNLDQKILDEVLIVLVQNHWKLLQTIIRDAKKENINLSDEKLWSDTNLSWMTDLDEQGAFKPLTIKTIPNKTENQLRAIHYLTKKTLFHLFQTKKISVSKSIEPQKFSLWTKIKNFSKRFFIPQKHLFPNDFVRLREAISLKTPEYLKPITNYKEFRQQYKKYQLLRKKYAKRIVREGEIISLVNNPVNLQKNIIEINNVSKYYLIDKNVNQTLNNIDLTIERGDFVVILGPSGAGKSSLLNLISGIDSPESGDLFVNGINLTLLNSAELTEFRRKYVGFIFQKYNLLTNLTAKENVEISEALLPDFKPAIKLEELFQLLEISDFANKYPFQLSGGQQQRFSIARALVKNPDILFCDEPTGALDQKMSLKVMKTLMHINDKYKTTIILVTHDQSFIKIAKTVIHFNDGKITNIYRNKVRLDPDNVNFNSA